MASLLGIDISHWQAKTPSLTGLAFVIVKATEGSGHADPLYSMHARNVLARGLYLGAYHWARSDAGIEAQAAWFIKHAVGATMLAIDVEQHTGTSRAGTRELIAAIKRLDPLRRPVVLYMSEKDTWTNTKGEHCGPFYTDVGADFNWPANWSVSPTVPWHLWQYSGSGLDRDRAVDEATLTRIFNGGSTAAPHFLAAVSTPTNLWNDSKQRWVWNGRNNIKVGTKLVIRGAKYVKGGQVCYPIVAGTNYGGYWVPIKNIKVGAKVP